MKFFPIIFLFFWYPSIAQTTISGVVVDSISTKPVPFALVCINTNRIGVLSNEKGEFRFSVPDSLKNKYLTVKCAGYNTDSITVNTFLRKKESILFLKRKQFTLPEVSISSNSENSCKYTWGAKRNRSYGGYFYGSG